MWSGEPKWGNFECRGDPLIQPSNHRSPISLKSKPKPDTTMAPNTTPVNRFICTSKRCLKVFRSLRVKKPKTEPETPTPPLCIRKEFYFSSTSLDKRRKSEDSWSVDTIITLLDDSCTLENRYNEKLEHGLKLIEGLV